MPMRPYIIEHARRFGLVATARYAAWRALDRTIGYTPYRCFIAPVSRAAAEPEVDGIVARPVTLSELARHIDQPRLDITAGFLAKARTRGDLCVAAFDRVRLVGYAFSSTIPTELDSEFSFSFPQGWVYNFKAFILPGYRGRRVHARLWEARRELFVRRGYEKMAGLVIATNYPSVRSFERLGFEQAFAFSLIGAAGDRMVVPGTAGRPSARAEFRLPGEPGEFAIYRHPQ